MVGLSVILENCKDLSAKRKPQVVSKGNIIKLPSNPCSPKTPPPNNNNNVFSTTTNYNTYCFLESCFLCQLKLLPGKDIYMYKGELGFCSEECRRRQIFMEEEEIVKSGSSTIEYNCSLAATSSPSTSNGGDKSDGNNNAFAY